MTQSISEKKSSQVSRRDLLQIAGGITFFALAPTMGGSAILRKGAAGEPRANFGKGPLPLFTAMPYLQAGSEGSKLVEGQESIVIAWQTNEIRADYKVLYGTKNFDEEADVMVVRAQGKGKEFEPKLNHTVTLKNLKLNTKYSYRVMMNGEKLLEGYFTTRKGRGTPTRWVSFGDNSFGDISDRAIAFEAYNAKPDFIMNTGDLVYNSGTDGEYARYFWPVYNSDEAGRRIGAPLLRSVPLYTVIANHDVEDKDANKHPVADFKKNPDSLGYYSNLHLPANGPASPTYPTPIIGPDDAIGLFKTAAGTRFPSQANYSFDYGDAHFLCLDSNVYVDPTDPALQAWIEQDLAGTDALWKFVVYHHPAFNVGMDHYEVQHMRVLSPLLEKHGVNIVFCGHEHNYQRTRPIKFVPKDVTNAKTLNISHRLVPGDFTIDRNFDGVNKTKADGIIYIVTGAGGKHLYDPEQNDKPESWLHAEDNNVDYVVQMTTDRHSLTILELNNRTLKLRQVDEWGAQIDSITVTI